MQEITTSNSYSNKNAGSGIALQAERRLKTISDVGKPGYTFSAVAATSRQTLVLRKNVQYTHTHTQISH